MNDPDTLTLASRDLAAEAAFQEARNAELAGELLDHRHVLRELLAGINRWARDEDGVPDHLWAAYQRARSLVGETP